MYETAEVRVEIRLKQLETVFGSRLRYSAKWCRLGGVRDEVGNSDSGASGMPSLSWPSASWGPDGRCAADVDRRATGIMKQRKVILICLLTIIAGCATVATYQQSCEELHSDFSSQMACTKAEVRGDWRSRGKSADLVNLYLNAADVLVPQVEAGEKTAAQARLELSQLYVELKNIQDERQLNELYQSALWASIFNQYQAPTPITTNCSTFGNNTTCITR